VDIKNEFSWSQSRRRMFNECRRKYFYNYYGFWGGWSYTADRRTREIYILKKLQTLPMFLGDSVHRTIENYLNELRKRRAVLLSTLVKQFRGFMSYGFEESRGGKYRVNPKKYCGLLEHEYDTPVSEGDLDDLILQGELCLKNFYNSKVLNEINTMDINDWLPIEQFQDFSFEGTTIYVKIDFALVHEGKTIIYDWKTGKTAETDGTQLAAYALYATKKWGAELPNTTREYNCRFDQLNESKVGEKEIEEVKDEIRKSIAEMKELLFNPGSNAAREEDFERCKGPQCDYCNFKRVCFEKEAKD